MSIHTIYKIVNNINGKVYLDMIQIGQKENKATYIIPNTETNIFTNLFVNTALTILLGNLFTNLKMVNTA